MQFLKTIIRSNPALANYLGKHFVSAETYRTTVEELSRRIATLDTRHEELLGWHRKLFNDHQNLERDHQNLERDHQNLERDKRNADKEIQYLLGDSQRLLYLDVLKQQDLFLVGDIIIEAPYPPVSPNIRDALSTNAYESVELYLASKLIRPGDTVLDLGSGLGLSAITAAKAAQGGRVVGYEADPRVAHLAQSNARRNDVVVEIRNSAISREEGTFTFYQAEDFLANSMLPFEGGTAITVPCASFSAVISELRPQVLTCDIEGVEGTLFEGCDLSSIRRIVLETHEHFLGKEGVQKCIDDLAANGLKKVDALCWGPVLVFDRDGLTSEIPPFTIKPRGGVDDQYYPSFMLHDVPDLSIYENVFEYRQSTNVAKNAPLVWYVPNWLHWWGGGIYTILRFAKLISDRGIPTVLYVYDNDGFPTLEKLKSDLDVAYPGHKIEVTTDITRLPPGHIAVATTHQSVFSVLRAPPCAARFYLMQEFESLLYPGGTQAEQANATYQLGFKGICGGDWLRSIFESFGGKAIKFDFAVDDSIFYSDRAVREEVSRLFFFGRPSSERRMYDLGVAALQKINEKYPNVEIIIAGLDGLKTLPFPATYLGNLSIAETGDLYRRCDVGLTLSGSNLSYLPLELMACGVPVLTNRGPQLDWYCKHLENSYCAFPFASDFLRGFDALYASKSLREQLVDGGFAAVSSTSWVKEAAKICEFIESEVGWKS